MDKYVILRSSEVDGLHLASTRIFNEEVQVKRTVEVWQEQEDAAIVKYGVDPSERYTFSGARVIFL